jgi:hypothetical protein
MGALMQEWQKDVWAACTGVNPREIKVISTGRQTGKTVFSQIVQQWNDMLEQQQQPVRTIDRELVDDDMWYTVEVKKEVAAWIRRQNKDSWHEHNGYRSVKYLFDVSGRLYTMLNLKW